MSKIEDVRIQVANSLHNVLDESFFLFNENLNQNQYRTTWMNRDGTRCVVCQVGDVDIVECPIITVIFSNVCVG
jgi:hypothetical protein